ncbi:MAG: NUDIX hydrolase [Acidobacteriota bacterium]|nr:NUDIX hydrolase [Acidobacteriota bacterium]
MSDPFRVVATENLLHSHVFDVETRTVSGPAGSFRRDVVVHPGAVAVLARDADGRVGLIRQYRAPFDRLVLEIPAGTLDVEAETPESCARRELREELGHEADTWRLLGRFLVSPGWCTQVMHIFEATDLRAVGRRPEGPEETAAEVIWLAPADLRTRLDAEGVCDSTMAVALNRVYGTFFG